MYYYYIFLVAFTIAKTHAEVVEQKIEEYFNSDGVATFRNMWDKHRKPLENAIASALQDSVGMEAMNVYIRKNNDKLSRGYFHDDNLVQLILSDLDLEEVPRFWKPDVSLSLASNVFKIESHLSKMIVHAEYQLLRNKSDIIYEAAKQNASKTSPFLFEQVQTMGQIAISLDRCILTGFAVVTLSGAAINLGQDFFKLSGCQYTVEIYRLGLGSPPVIANYFPIGHGLDLNHLVLHSIYEDVVPKLQATLLSFVNTSNILLSELQNLRKHQESVFRMTSGYLSEVVRNVNKLTIEKNKGALELEDHTFVWDDMGQSGSGNISRLKLTELVVTGLDTVYPAHTGGPYKITNLQIGEEIRFSTIQVRGNIVFDTTPFTRNNQNEFAAQLDDLGIDVVMNVNTKSMSVLKKFELAGLRGMQFSLSGLIFAPVEPLVTGYLLSEVPKQLLQHLKPLFEQAILETNKKVESDDPKVRLYSLYSSISSENELISGLLSKGEQTVAEIELEKPDFSNIFKLRNKVKGHDKRTGLHLVKKMKKTKPAKAGVKGTKKFNIKTNA